MSKLAAVAERIARTRRWLDQEVERLAARLDQFERRAPMIFQEAHRVLDAHQRDLEAAEELIRQGGNASQGSAVVGAGKPRAPQQANGSPPRAQPKPPSEGVPVLLDAAQQLNEQQRNVGRLERALQTLTTEMPEPQVMAASATPRAQPNGAGDDGAVPLDSRRLLEEAQYRDEIGLERALQTLATKLQAPDATAATPLVRARSKPPGGELPAPVEPLAQAPEEAQQIDDAAMPAATRKPGVIRVA